MLALEIFAIKFRKPEDITGIQLPRIAESEVTVKIAQYADDMTLFVKEKKDLLQSIKMLKKFHEVSGLKLNESKTEAMWLGKQSMANKLSEV